METKAVPAGKKLGFFASLKYKKIIKELNGPAPDQYMVFDKTKGWFARKYPEKAIEIAGLLAKTDTLGITKAAELSEYLVGKGRVAASAEIVKLIEGMAAGNQIVPKEALETLGRVRTKIAQSKEGKNLLKDSYLYGIDGSPCGVNLLENCHIDSGANGEDGSKK